MATLMTPTAESEVFRGNGIEHDRSTPMVERSYSVRRSRIGGGDQGHTGLVTQFRVPCRRDTDARVPESRR
jgi:hypothetical protein